MQTLKSSFPRQMGRGTFLLVTGILLVLPVATLLTGCSKKSSRFAPLANYMREQDILTDNYFKGDAAQARKSLGDLLDFYQNPKTQLLTDSARAQMAYETYERLYVLETRVGNSADADAALAKVKEYRLKFYKLSNVSDANIAKETANLTPDNIRSAVDEVDQRENNGQLPQYARTAQSAQK